MVDRVRTSRPLPSRPAPATKRPVHHSLRAQQSMRRVDQQHEASHNKPRRTRMRKATVQDDIYYIPLDEIPEGSSYEWKRWTVAGAHDPFYIAQMRQQGWEPVDPKRHPNWVPPGYSEPHIIKGGMILMERPMELTEEARREQAYLARQQVREAEQRLGMTPRNTLERAAVRITKEVVRAVPAEQVDEADGY